MKKKVVLVGIVAGILALMVGGLSFAQPGQRGQGGPGQRGPGQRGNFDPERIRQMMSQRLKEQLGADDAAWKVMEPRLMKVMELNRQVSGGFGRTSMFGGGFAGSGQRGGDTQRPGGTRGPLGPTGREQTAIEKASVQLRTLLEDESSSAEQIKNQLQALRTAREKAKQELATAQQELRQILTMRQEAQLVLMGLLT